MSKIGSLKIELDEKERAIEQQENEAFEKLTLSDEDREKLEKMKNEKKIVVVDQQNGTSVEVSLDQYFEDIDGKIQTLEDTNIKLLSQDIMNDKDKVMKQSRSRIIGMLKDVSVKDINEETVDTMIDDAMDAIKKLLKVDELNGFVIPKLAKMRFDTLVAALPEEFVDTFVDKMVAKISPMKAKEMLLTSIQLLFSIGPELDNLSDYIETEQKKMEVYFKLQEANIDFLQLIRNEASLREITEQVLRRSNELNNTYKMYTKDPDGINKEFTQRSIIYSKLAAAYEQTLKDLTEPIHIEKVKQEIELNRIMSELYLEVIELKPIQDAADNMAALMNGKKKFRSQSDIEKSVFETLTMINKYKQRLQFPGYTGKEQSIKEIILAYLNYFKVTIEYYNKIVTKAREDGNMDLQPVTVDSMKFAYVLLMVTGRYMKKHIDAENIRDSVEIHAIFEIYCRLAGNLFVMDKLNKILTPIFGMIDHIQLK